MKTLDLAPEANGLLHGIRVVDLSRLVAGNLTTHVLADYGADVVKVERPGKGDDLRAWRVAGIETFWKVFARNKRSLELDIHAEDGRDLLLRLIDSAQVLVENFVPGTLGEVGPRAGRAAGAQPEARDGCEGQRGGINQDLRRQPHERHRPNRRKRKPRAPSLPGERRAHQHCARTHAAQPALQRP